MCFISQIDFFLICKSAVIRTYCAYEDYHYDIYYHYKLRHSYYVLEEINSDTAICISLWSVIIMALTIQYALRPLFIMCFIVGLGFYPIERSNLKLWWIAYFNIPYSLTLWSAYSYFLYYAINTFALKTLRRSIITVIVLIINILITYISVIMNLCYRKV